MKISSHEIARKENIESLNRFLEGRNIRIEEDYDDPYSNYTILKDQKIVFETIYPKELIIKIAQLIPESEVRLGRYEVYVRDEDFSQETLVIQI